MTKRGNVLPWRQSSLNDAKPHNLGLEITGECQRPELAIRHRHLLLGHGLQGSRRDNWSHDEWNKTEHVTCCRKVSCDVLWRFMTMMFMMIYESDGSDHKIWQSVARCRKNVVKFRLGRPLPVIPF